MSALHDNIHALHTYPATWLLVMGDTRAQVYSRVRPKARPAKGKPGQREQAELVPVTGMQWRAELGEDTTLCFLLAVASQLQAAWASGKFERLVLIAPSALLDGLKELLDEDLMECVVAELRKDPGGYGNRGVFLQWGSLV